MTSKSRKKRDARPGSSGKPHRRDEPERPTAKSGAGLAGLVARPWFWPVTILVAALVLRIVYTFQVRYTPFFQTLGLDAKFYDQWARELAAGASERGAFFMTPLYSYFLAAVYRLFGRDLLLVRLVQAGLGSATAALTYLIGRDVFDRRIGVVSGLMVATYGAVIFYDCSILLTPLLVFLNTLAVFLLVRADDSDRSALYLAAGCVLGLAAIGRAAALLAGAGAVLWVWLSPRGKEAPVRSATIRRASLVVLGIIVVIAPITIRNFVVEQDFVPITSNGGLNFYIGNGETANGGYVKPDGLDIITDPDGRAIAESAVGGPLKPSEVSGYWYRRAWSHVASDPLRWGKLMIRKLVFVTSSYELPQLENYHFQRRFSGLLSLPLPGFAVIAPLGLLGLGLTFRRRRSRLLGIYSSVYLLSLAAFFIVARYRLPAVPILCVLAAYALLELIGRIRRGEWRVLVIPVVALALLGYLVNANHYGINRDAGFSQPHFRLGIIYAERGMLEAAISEYETAILLDPGYAKSYLNLGASLTEAGRVTEAADAFRHAVRVDPGYADARINLAMLMERTGEYDRALSQVDSVLALDAHNARALKERAIILHKAGGDSDEVARWLTEALRWDSAGEERAEIEFYMGLLRGQEGGELPPDVVAALDQANELTRTGRPTEAAEVLERAAVIAPNSGEPLRRLALLKRDMGLLGEALELMAEALRVDPSLDRGHYMYGVFLNEAGRHDEALLEYDAETRIHPDFAPAHLNLALTHNFHAGNPNLAAYHYRRHLSLGGERVPALDAVLRDMGAPESP